MYEQLSIFSFLEPQEKLFNPIEDYARHGSGFSGGKQRIVNFFNSNQSLSERAEFLKKEYGIGGFGMPCKKPFVVHGGNHDSKGNTIEYYNENMERVTVFATWNELAKTIGKMIEKGEYK